MPLDFYAAMNTTLSDGNANVSVTENGVRRGARVRLLAECCPHGSFGHARPLRLSHGAAAFPALSACVGCAESK